MSEIQFKVEALPEGGFLARAVGADIFTEADNLFELHERVRDAVRCHFDEGAAPTRISVIIEESADSGDPSWRAE